MIPEKVGNFSGILIVFLINTLILTTKLPFFTEFLYLLSIFLLVDNNYHQYGIHNN